MIPPTPTIEKRATGEAFRKFSRVAAMVLLAAAGFCPAAPAAQAAADFVEGIQPGQVFPYKGYLGDIPFRAKVTGYLSAIVSESETGTVVAEGRWEITPSAPPAFERPGRVVSLIRTSSRDLYIANVPINRRGPYTIQFTHGEQTQEFTGILVGDLWVVCGSVNLFATPGRMPLAPMPGVHFLRDGKWETAQDPLFPSEEPLPPRHGWISPWLRAAQEYHQATGIPVGIMGWVNPSLSLMTCWDPTGAEIPPLKNLIEKHGRGASVLLWWQGEADAYPEAIAQYGARLEMMAKTIRRYADNPDMFLVVLQAPRFQDPLGRPPTPYLGRVRDIQRRFCLEDPWAVLIPTTHYPQRDPLRLDERAVQSLGVRLGETLTRFKETREVPRKTARPVSAAFANPERRQILVYFENADRLVLGPEPEKDWTVIDNQHRGYEEASVEEIRDGVLALRLKGARFDSVLDASDDGLVRIQLKDRGFVGVMRVSLQGSAAVRLNLSTRASPGAKVSYGLWDNARGSLRDGDGNYIPAFLDLPVAEPGDAPASGSPEEKSPPRKKTRR